MRTRLRPLLVAILALFTPHALAQPNIVLIVSDDQGYGDLSCYGHPTIHTPHTDRMASEGAKLTQFYVAAPLCSPSRVAMLTGCYPKRVGMHKHVIFPPYDYGLHPDEVTLADMLGEIGYATGCFGKWHLGHRPGLLPTSQGFDTFYGVPYSNDMSRFHRPPDATYPHRLPLMRDETVIEWEPDQRDLTKRCTQAAVEFIEDNADRPFFVYVPHSMPHIPIYASAEFEGTSPRGLYGDVIEEIDWSVGEIRAALERAGVADNTLVMFTSDNGPWLSYKAEGGSSGPLRGGKGSNFEGGQRVPFVAWWPDGIEPGIVVRDVVNGTDILPTVAAITDAPLPDRMIDGIDVTPIFSEDKGEGGGEGRVSADRPFLYYTNQGELAGVRQGPWKVLFGDEPKLFNVEVDISEEWNLAPDHAERVAEMTALAQEMDASFEMRPVLTVEEPAFTDSVPRILLLGDSISMGYHNTVVELLRERAIVVRPKENCAGTTKGITKIQEWVALEGGDFDIIHFNFGLHDLKRVKPDGKNSNDPTDPRQANVETYAANLESILDTLESTGATLIFATTTPFPAGVRPHRDPEDADRYNAAALELMRSRGVEINDIHGFATPILPEIQPRVDVHFTREGSTRLGEFVASRLAEEIAVLE